VLKAVKEHFVSVPFKRSDFSGGRSWVMEQSSESKTSKELRQMKGKREIWLNIFSDK